MFKLLGVKNQVETEARPERENPYGTGKASYTVSKAQVFPGFFVLWGNWSMF